MIKGGEGQQEGKSRKFASKNKRERKNSESKSLLFSFESSFIPRETDFYQSKFQFLLSLSLITYLIFPLWNYILFFIRN